MEEAKELFRTILKSSTQENCEDIHWEPLESHQKRECLNNGIFDVDFCAVSGLTQQLLNDRMVQHLLANSSGTFVRHPYTQRLHGYRLQKVLVICDIQPFKIAVSLNENLEENESDFVQPLEEKPENSAQNSSFIRNVASLLETVKGRTFPFRDLKVKIESNFEGFELILFQFGQKQEVDLFLTHVEKMSNQVQLTIALGLELFLNNFLLLVTPENLSVGECFFSMLLSPSAGSILLGAAQASKVIPNSKR